MILDHDVRVPGRRYHGHSKSFVISPAQAEDVRRLVDIEFHAFEFERVNQVLSYRDYKKPAHFERAVAAYTHVLEACEPRSFAPKVSRPRSDSKVDPSQPSSRVSFLKVTDTESGDIISFAKTEFKKYTLDELSSRADIGHEGEAKMNRDWFALNEQLRRDYVGLAEHCYIGMLATRPSHQHNGAGTMLLHAILAEADAAGVEVYLEGTDTAKPMYEKNGFVAVDELRFDPAEYGMHGLGRERQTVMVRGALGKDGHRRGVRSWDAAVAQARAELASA